MSTTQRFQVRPPDRDTPPPRRAPAARPNQPTRTPRPVDPYRPARWSHTRADRAAERARSWTERGQATAEYALVLLGAAAVALMLAAWAAKSGMIGKLFDAVVGQLIDKV